MMPGMDGLQMCQILRNTPTTTDTPVIILSAKAKPEDVKAGYQAGADHYVTKPFEPLELASLIEDMMV